VVFIFSKTQSGGRKLRDERGNENEDGGKDDDGDDWDKFLYLSYVYAPAINITGICIYLINPLEIIRILSIFNIIN
jgi:hypothetical protein